MKRFLHLFKPVRDLEQRLKKAQRCIYAMKTMVDVSKLSTLQDLALYEATFNVPEAIELWEGVEAQYWAQREKRNSLSGGQS